MLSLCQSRDLFQEQGETKHPPLCSHEGGHCWQRCTEGPVAAYPVLHGQCPHPAHLSQHLQHSIHGTVPREPGSPRQGRCESTAREPCLGGTAQSGASSQRWASCSTRASKQRQIIIPWIWVMPAKFCNNHLGSEPPLMFFLPERFCCAAPTAIICFHPR